MSELTDLRPDGLYPELSHERNITLYFRGIISDMLKPLVDYGRGGEDARLHIELNGRAMDVKEVNERGKRLLEKWGNHNTFDLSSARQFCKAYIFSGMLLYIYEAEIGNVKNFSIEREGRMDSKTK